MKTKVGYLGPNMSTFGYLAAEKCFLQQDGKAENSDVEFVSYKNHEEICLAAGKKEIKFGVVAIENVIDGVVPETVRAIENVDGYLGLKVQAEVVVPIELFCMRSKDTEQSFKKLVSHPVAVRQCSKFVSKLQEENPGLVVEYNDSTGAAAEEASKNPEVAVIASAKACQIYGLEYIHDGSVTDHKDSLTRFWVISKEHADRSGKDKTCFLVNLEQSVPGSLWKAIGVFASRGINLLLIYPCPVPGKQWEYTFLLELEGYVTDKKMDEAWLEFRKLGLSLTPPRFIGSYPNTTSK